MDESRIGNLQAIHDYIPRFDGSVRSFFAGVVADTQSELSDNNPVLVLIVVGVIGTFGLFANSTVWASNGMHDAQRGLWRLRDVDDEDDFERLIKELDLLNARRRVRRMYGLGLVGFISLITLYVILEFLK